MMWYFNSFEAEKKISQCFRAEYLACIRRTFKSARSVCWLLSTHHLYGQ